MRSVFIEESFSAGSLVYLNNARAHHLINVLRVKTGDEIMLLDGNGLVGEGKIIELSKRDVKINCLNVYLKPRPSVEFTLGVGQLKKDAMDDVLKAACELGISKVLILNTEFSQNYKLNLDRISKLLISGIEQSNNPFLPTIETIDIDQIKWDGFRSVYLFTLNLDQSEASIITSLDGSNLILIGPEGGFSRRDLDSIPSEAKNNAIELNLPIMRAPTAFKCAVGYLQAFC